MRYLILAAGMGKRMGADAARVPKCLLDVGGEPLIGRLLRQIRAYDREADVYVVVGYRAEAVVAAAPGCRIVANPFFDITGVNASLWFGRAAFAGPAMIIHGDVVLSESLAVDLFTAEPESLIAFDSSVLNPKEINLGTADGKVTRFGVNFDRFAGAYAGIVKLSARAANAFATTLDRRIQRGFNEARTYYFFVVRSLINDYGIRFVPFDFAGRGWAEIDYAADLAVARARIVEWAGNDGR